MTHLLSRRRANLPLILIPLFVSLACQLLQPGSSSTAAPEPESDNKTFEAEVTFGSGPFNFPESVAGLTELSSYKATLTLAFDGINAGQPQQWSKTYIMLTSKEPAASQLTIEKTGDLADLDAVFMAEMDGAEYERRGEGFCSTNAIAEGYSLTERMEPAGFLTAVIGADEAGSETVNDVGANHYTFDERALGQTDITKSVGEIWVASEGGYIVKYLTTTTGTADYFGEGIEGTLTWDYELTDVNKPVEIKLPDDCPPGLVDAPMLPDATNVENLAGVLSYDTATSLTDTVAFYQKQIPDLGWKAEGKPTIGDTDEVLTFIKDKNYLTIIISTTDTGTQVRIVLIKAQQ